MAKKRHRNRRRFHSARHGTSPPPCQDSTSPQASLQNVGARRRSPIQSPNPASQWDSCTCTTSACRWPRLVAHIASWMKLRCPIHSGSAIHRNFFRGWPGTATAPSVLNGSGPSAEAGDIIMRNLRCNRRAADVAGRKNPSRRIATPSRTSRRALRPTSHSVTIVTSCPRAAKARACFQHCISAPPQGAGGNWRTSIRIFMSGIPRPPGCAPGNLPRAPPRATNGPHANSSPDPNARDISRPSNPRNHN